MDASNKESNSNHTLILIPFDNNLILKLVLEHVGRADVADLKNCRLVSHGWNKGAVEVLEQQHGYTIELDYKKMLEFRSLLWNTQLSQEMSSTELNDPLASLRLSLTVHPLRYSENLSEAAKWIQLLMSYQHLRIAFIECNYRIEDEQYHFPLFMVANPELFNLLKLASTDMTSITIVAHAFDDEEPYFQEFHVGCYESIEFPKLSSIHCVINSQLGSVGLDMTKHIGAVVHRAPKLIKLSLDVSSEANDEMNSWTKSLEVIMQSCAARLENLEIIEGFHGQVAKIVGRTIFPKLKTLKMENVVGSFNEFSQFLVHQCPALGKVDLKWFSASDDEDLTIIQICPTLVNINHFGLYPYGLTGPKDAEQIGWIFATMLTKFPCLNSMGINLGVLFMLGTHLNADLIPPLPQYPAFPNISSLEVHLVFGRFQMFGLMDMALQIYRHTFPNLRKLVIKVDIKYLSESQKIYQAIQLLTRQQPGLEILEIHNYAHDWLGQIQEDYQILQGLKSLKLIPLRRTTIPTAVGANNAGSPPRPRVDVTDFLTRFPALEKLQFGQAKLCKTEIQTIRSGLSSIGRFEKATLLQQ